MRKETDNVSIAFDPEKLEDWIKSQPKPEPKAIMEEDKATDESDNQSPIIQKIKNATFKGKTANIWDHIRDLPRNRYLIERLEIQKGQLGLLMGRGDSGKSFFLQYLAACFAYEKPLFGKFPIAGGKVVHIDGEQGEVISEKRYRRFVNAFDRTDSYYPKYPIMLVHPNGKFDVNDATLKQSKADLIQLLTGASLCIVDSLKFTSAVDENLS